MPMNSVSPVPTASQNDVQADVDALSHSLKRWARYPVTDQRAHELTAEFVQLNAAVQAGAESVKPGLLDLARVIERRVQDVFGHAERDAVLVASYGEKNAFVYWRR